VFLEKIHNQFDTFKILSTFYKPVNPTPKPQKKVKRSMHTPHTFYVAVHIIILKNSYKPSTTKNPVKSICACTVRNY